MGNLYDVFFYKTGAGTALVSWLLLGIDDLGMQLEQPYTVMALKSMCEDVQDEVVPETGRSEWTPRIGAPRDEVKASGFLNSELVGDETADATTQLASA